MIIEAGLAIAFGQFTYTLAKDWIHEQDWSEEDKLVDMNWPEVSGFGKEMSGKGYELGWCKPENVETKKYYGVHVMYEIDESKKVRRRLVLRDGLVLIGKKDA